MNTRQLQYVITLAEEKSFSEASNKLLISQPSLSQYIQKLEKELGVELFERTVPLKLTYAGEIYTESAKKILALEKEMMEQMTDILGGKKGKIYLGAGFLNSITLIPNIVSLYQKEYPDVEVFVDEDMEPNLKVKADAGELDLIISTSKFEDTFYEKVELYEEEFLLAVPKNMSFGRSGHECQEIASIDIEKTEKLPMVLLRSNTYIRQIIEESFRKKGIKPKCTAVCTSVVGAYGMVKAGVGATLIPYSTYKNDYSPNIDYYRIADNDYKRMVCIYYNKNRYISRIMTEFINAARKYFKEIYSVE